MYKIITEQRRLNEREKTDLQYDSLEASNHDFRLQDITN